MKARSAKAKGYRLEKEVVKSHEDAGIPARRQPGSGIFQDFPHDVEINIGGEKFIGECKKRASLPKTFDRWLGGADFVFMAPDRQPPSRVYMRYEAYMRLAKKAHGDPEGGNGR